MTNTLLALGGWLAATLACSLGTVGLSNSGNIIIVKRETPLENLSNSQYILTLVDNYSGSKGLYWLDLDHHTLYLARLPEAESTVTAGEYTWVPEPDMSVWNGNELVYGSRVTGFFSLSPDGKSQQITGQGYVGRLAYNGKQILRFSQCGENNDGRSYAITSLDQLVPSTAPCFSPGYFRSDDEIWKYVEPVWNPYLPQVDFIVSERYGRGDQLTVTSNKLVRLTENDELLEILDVGTDFDILGKNIIPSPDGRAFYIRKAYDTFIIDASGNRIVDLKERTNQFSGKELNGRFAWSPDSQQALLVMDRCPDEINCIQTIILMRENFQQLQEITTFPTEFQFDEIIWSPDSSHIALVKRTHEGPDFPPHVYTIDLLNKSVNDYVFPTQSILENIQWVR